MIATNNENPHVQQSLLIVFKTTTSWI